MSNLFVDCVYSRHEPLVSEIEQDVEKATSSSTVYSLEAESGQLENCHLLERPHLSTYIH